MLDVFHFRGRLIEEYASFSRSFSRIGADDIAAAAASGYARGRYWPEPLVQINPNYARKGTVGDLVRQKSLHADCEATFQSGKLDGAPELDKTCGTTQSGRSPLRLRDIQDRKTVPSVTELREPDATSCSRIT